jgi:hypothetical protein
MAQTQISMLVPCFQSTDVINPVIPSKNIQLTHKSKSHMTPHIDKRLDMPWLVRDPQSIVTLFQYPLSREITSDIWGKGVKKEGNEHE